MKRKLRFAPVFWWLAVALWGASVIYLSSLTPQELVTWSPWFARLFQLDKLAHAVLFGIGAVFLGAALETTWRWTPLRVTLLIILGISLFGASDEWHQLRTPGRSGADVADWIADTIGATLGALIYCYGGTIFRKSARPRRGTAAGAAGAQPPVLSGRSADDLG